MSLYEIVKEQQDKKKGKKKQKGNDGKIRIQAGSELIEDGIWRYKKVGMIWKKVAFRCKDCNDWIDIKIMEKIGGFGLVRCFGTQFHRCYNDKVIKMMEKTGNLMDEFEIDRYFKDMKRKAEEFEEKRIEKWVMSPLQRLVKYMEQKGIIVVNGAWRKIDR